MTDSNSDNNKTGHRKSIRVHGKLVTRTFTRKADAEKWYAERKREKELIDRGLRNETPEITFSRYLDEWLTRRKATGKPLSSWMTDEQRLRGHVKPLVGDRLLTRVTTREWEALLDQLVSGKDLSTGTRNRVRATLHKLYNDARRQGYVEVNPITAVPRLEEARNKWDYFHHHDEVEKYLRSSVEEGPNFRLFAMLALNTGLRTGEMLALSLGDVDFTHRRLRIWRTYEQCSRTIQERVKGGQHQRWIGINSALFEVLAEHKMRMGSAKPETLLLQREDGRAATEDWARVHHWKTCDRAEVRRIRLHDLRHTFASHFVMNGGSIMDLRMILDHADITTTQRYAHLAPGYLEAQAGVVTFGKARPQAEVLSLRHQSHHERHRGQVSQTCG